MPASHSAALRRSNVDIDTRRSVFMLAQARPQGACIEEKHEDFIRRTLKDKLGWPRREPAPQAIKDAAKAMATQLMARDKAKAEAALAAKAKATADRLESEKLGDRIADVLEAREAV
jgi:hypothetical protein